MVVHLQQQVLDVEAPWPPVEQCGHQGDQRQQHEHHARHVVQERRGEAAGIIGGDVQAGMLEAIDDTPSQALQCALALDAGKVLAGFCGRHAFIGRHVDRDRQA